MRSLAASVLAVGILLGGAGAALADDGFGAGYFSAGGAGFSSHCAVAGCPGRVRNDLHRLVFGEGLGKGPGGRVPRRPLT